VQLTDLTVHDGIVQRRFTLDAAEPVPGVVWTPVEPAGDLPLVLIAHGGGAHKLHPGVAARATCYVTECGFAAAAIDAPGHGDRPSAVWRDRWAAVLADPATEGQPMSVRIAPYHARLAAQAVPEWQAALDMLLAVDGIGGPVGFWGLSQGAAIGIPLVVSEPRIVAAVFGLIGGPDVLETATRITVPVEFDLQWDDELVPREDGLALFDAFGSADKSLHANPGSHVDMPRFEVESSVRFFGRHLRG
jgi:hypothetical protein